MLGTIAMILVIIWLVGLFTSYPIGGYIHILLIVATVLLLVRAFRGQRPKDARLPAEE